MIVLDASVVVDLLLDLEPAAARIRARVQADPTGLAAPHLLDAEVAQVLRRFTLRGDLSEGRARGALDDLTSLRIHRYPHAPLLGRAFDLYANTTIYDALYLVLAEALEAPLLTRDASLQRIPGCAARVDVL